MTQGTPAPPYVLERLKAGAYFYKHERGKRTRKWVVLSNDLHSLRWRSVGPTENVRPGDGAAFSSTATPRSIARSLSFSKFQSVAFADVSHLLYGAFTEVFSKKSEESRQDERQACFSLIMRDNKTIDFAAEDVSTILPWLYGMQQLISWLSTAPQTLEKWTMPKLRLQKLRLKVAGESERSGRGPYNIVLDAVDRVIDDREQNNDKLARMHSVWQKRNAHFTFQTAVGEMLRINNLIEVLSAREHQLKDSADEQAIAIERALQLCSTDQAPPRTLSNDGMGSQKRVHQYMLELCEFSARQELRLQAMSSEVQENQRLLADAEQISIQKRRLQAINARLRSSLSRTQEAALTDEEKAYIAKVECDLGIVPCSSKKAASMREAQLHKDSANTRLGIMFYQTLPSQLDEASGDDSITPTSDARVVIPIIKAIDPAGIAGRCPDLLEGDEVLLINGQPAISNVVAVKLLREAVGPVVLTVRPTSKSQLPSQASSPRSVSAVPHSQPGSRPTTGLKPLNAKPGSHFSSGVTPQHM